MELQCPKIVTAERIDGGVFIVFDDDKAALYSAALLYATFSQAEEVLETDLDD